MLSDSCMFVFSPYITSYWIKMTKMSDFILYTTSLLRFIDHRLQKCHCVLKLTIVAIAVEEKLSVNYFLTLLHLFYSIIMQTIN